MVSPDSPEAVKAGALSCNSQLTIHYLFRQMPASLALEGVLGMRPAG
jgi:hypothetical protein